MSQLVTTSNQLVIQQVKEWAEILIDWETVNRYQILDTQDNQLGYVAERHLGFWTIIGRQFFRSHRPLQVDIFDKTKQVVYHLSRKFFFFFSDLHVDTAAGKNLGSIHRRFAFFQKKYDLCDERGNVFARVKSPFWRIWKFPIVNSAGQEQGVITKKWGGVLKEVFTDADRYFLDYGSGHWTENQKVVILATAISIDFDFFEDNQRRN